MDFTDETIPMPRIGDQAPVFDAVTTQGKIHFPLDFSGKWIILFSHPSDFTPVCTSEFVTLRLFLQLPPASLFVLLT